MLLKFIWPELENTDIEEMWLETVNNMCHITNATFDLLKISFLIESFHNEDLHIGSRAHSI